MSSNDIENIEIRLLLEGIFQQYGHDFRDYAEASIRRRLKNWLVTSPYKTFSEAQSAILRDPAICEGLVRGITVNVSEMFRDPSFFKAIRETVVPYLRTYPFIKVWHAGCASGEEAYSLSILLKEEGFNGRFRIYATDINTLVLQKAQEGIWPLADMQKFTTNYQKAGGKACFSDYYTARYDFAMLMPFLKEHIVFASHSLAIDAEFGEMHMVFCRNVLIYFQDVLKDRAIWLFDRSLLPGGFLCLGTKETMESRAAAAHYEEIVKGLRIYRKRYV